MKRLLRRYLSNIGQFFNVCLRGAIKVGQKIRAALWVGESSLYSAIANAIDAFQTRLDMLAIHKLGKPKSAINSAAAAHIELGASVQKGGRSKTISRFFIDITIHRFVPIASRVLNNMRMAAGLLVGVREKAVAKMRSLGRFSARINKFSPRKVFGRFVIADRAKASIRFGTPKSYSGGAETHQSGSACLTKYGVARASANALIGQRSATALSVVYWLYPRQTDNNLAVFQVLDASAHDGTLTITND